MPRSINRILPAILLLVALSGCERRQSEPSIAATQPAGGQTRAGTGIIEGTVTLAGRPPVMQAIVNQPCHAGVKPIMDESVVVDASGHLDNVVVYLEEAPPAPPTARLSPTVMDQIDCRFAPHVIAARTGQTVHFLTRDPTLHNVHGLCTINPAFNFALVAPGQSRDLAFTNSETFPVRCDVHPWMKAYVCVFAHPYFAVTNAAGHFAIKNVPAGTFTLVAWQEKYGTSRSPVRVDDTKVTAKDFVFQSGL